MPRECRRWRRDLWREVDGFLPARERERLQAHLAGCAGCRAVLEAARRLDRVLATEPIRLPARGFEDRVLLGIAAGVESHGPPVAPRRRPAKERAAEEAGDWWILGGGLAAAALIATAAFSVVPRLALRAVQSAVSPHPSPGGTLQLLVRGFKAFAASGQVIAALLQSPLLLPLSLMAGVLALTLGWVRLVLSRSEG